MIAGVVVGGIVGCLLVLALILLLLALVWKYKRETYKLQQHRVGGELGGDVTETQGHLPGNEMKNNEAYISTVLQITTEDNVAYVQTNSTDLKIPTEDNVAYVRTENDCVNDQNEYDYV